MKGQIWLKNQPVWKYLELPFGLGFPEGYFKNGCGLVRNDVDDISGMNLCMPSGNKAGANSLWVSGGYTLGGVPEAIMDTIPLSAAKVTRIEVE